MTLRPKAFLKTHTALRPELRLLAFICVMGAMLTPATCARAQGSQPDSISSPPSVSDHRENSATGQSFGEPLLAPDDASSSPSTFSNVATTAGALPADQIIQILQQNPDLLTEVKSQVAERLQQQGAQIQASDVSDEMLYSQISTNDSVRMQVTTFLQAHGYATQGTSGLGEEGLTAGASSVQNGLPATDGRVSTAETDGSQENQGRSGTTAAAVQRSLPRARGKERTHASTDAPVVLHRPAPYTLRSMRDLYTQIPDHEQHLKRFGSEVFETRSARSLAQGISGFNTPLDVPLDPDYIIGTGDTLQINLWGGVTLSFKRAIDREGRILLPEAGSLQVAGLPLREAEEQIAGALKQQYRNAKVSVTVTSLHSVRVYVTGDVQRPGGYDLSSLATPLSALYAAGGPTSVGSLRILRHYRGQRLIEEVDLYDFLLHGVQKGSARFEAGDTLQVPPAGPQIAISGAVIRPAIYELKLGELTSGESNLSTVIADAGGVTAAASLNHITIERIDANRQRETVTLQTGKDLQSDRAAIAAFIVHDGDRIHIGPILPYSQRVVYLQGHVVRPGRLSFTDGMRLSDVLHSYRDMLPEPADHGEIVRLVPPDLHAETIPFNVPDVLIGNANVSLQPFDTVRVFGRYEVDTPTVAIHGEVLRPGTYPMSKGMTAAQLVLMAGGFKRDALLESADLTSYRLEGGGHVDGKLATIAIGAAVSGKDAAADVALKPGDILTIHQITGWNEIGEAVTIQGQVRFPGSYGFREGERLSSVLRRAGGLRETAYPAGAVLIRQQVRDLEEKSRQELIQEIETSSSAARLGPALGSGDTGGTLQLIKAQQEQALAQLKSHPATGRMVIHIGADIDSWANTPADIELRRGDVLTIPKRPEFVLVTGQVYNSTALTFTPHKTAGWYLSRAGGSNSTANRNEIFIIRANGSVVGRHSGGWFDSDVLSTRMDPGDVIVVPQKIIGGSLLWRNLLTTAQLASSIAITAGIAAAAL